VLSEASGSCEAAGVCVGSVVSLASGEAEASGSEDGSGVAVSVLSVGVDSGDGCISGAPGGEEDCVGSGDSFSDSGS
jgi:hypothetical protein